MARRFLALAGRPSSSIPLAAAYLREPDAITPTRAGPATVPAVEPDDSFAPGFDFSVFNSAHPLQRTDLVERDAILDLTHLSASSPRRRIRLPGVAPRVLVDCGDGDRAMIDPPCDTVWIDTDEERVVLLWRAVVLVSPSLVERVIVSLEPAEGGRDERAIRRAVPRAHFSFASEVDRLPPAAQDEDEEDDLLVARYTALCAEDGVDPTITMDEYATVSAELAEAGPDRAEVLARHDLNEDTWLLEERGWIERLTSAAEAGDATPAIEYGEAFRAAQARLAKPVPDGTLEDYAAMCAAMEVEDTGKVLERHKLTLPAWSRLDESWSDRIDGDPALASRFEAELTAARASFPEPGEEGGS